MKTRIVLAGLLVSMIVVEVSAQHAEYDDMYFRGKDREKNKAIDAEETYASAKTKKQKPDEVTVEEADNVNPTDSYSARNVNPEYVSRSNSEKASEDETNYYLEGYTPPAASSTSDFNNSYYNNANWANSNYYANNSLSSPYYGSCGCNSYMNPAFGYGPSYGWNSGWSVSLTYGNYWSPYGGYGMYSPYYGYGNPYYGSYGYPNYYGGNNYYYEAPRVVNYGKRPSRNSAGITPSTRPGRDNVSTNTSTPGNTTKVASTGRPTRVRQVQDEYYVRPARRASNSLFSTTPTQNSGNDNGFLQHQNTQPTRTRETYSPPTRTPSYTPSSTPSPSRGNSGGSGGGGGGSSSPRRGRG